MEKPSSVDVKLDLKVFSVSGTWEPNDHERNAAWELYVELITRVSTVELSGGILREALSSFYTLFDTARDVLKRYGPDVAEAKPNGQPNLAYISISILNYAVRPLLTYWHPLLEAWEDDRVPGTSRATHEAAWDRAVELRGEIEFCRRSLTAYANILSAACGVPNLLD